MHSDWATGGVAWELLGDGMMTLFSDISTAIVIADAIYEHVSSSDQCFPGDIQGMLIIYANTSSGERCLFFIAV